VDAIQKYIESFEYNYSGKPFFKLIKSKGTKHVHASATSLMEAALPIQCVEAVFIALFLTSPLKSVVRIPISFKSRHAGNSHRHIVLAVFDKSSNMWGALGLSRRTCLMYKPLTFNTLSDLLHEFEQSYESCFHKLTKVYLADVIAHDLNANDRAINWKAETIKVTPDRPTFDSKIDAYLDSKGIGISKSGGGK
jgi:hypothetical protein